MFSSNHRHDRSDPPSFDPIEDNDDIITIGGDSDVESMADWFDGEQMDELSQKPPAKIKEAMNIEVCAHNFVSCFTPDSFSL